MSTPAVVTDAIDGEEVAARVPLGGDDELFVTPSRTVLYRAEGLLSDESTEEFPHGADRLTVSEGRRKTKLGLEYPIDGTREFTVPAKRTDDVLLPVLAGVLSGNGITEPGETVVELYRFSELTLIVTSDRLVKHVGEAVWDGDYEDYEYADVTNLAFEDGAVATQIVLTVGDRPQRIKAPNEDASDLRERLTRALFEYHGVDSLEELNDTLGDDEPEEVRDATAAFDDRLDPLGTNSADEGPATGGDDASMGGRDDPLAGGDPLGTGGDPAVDGDSRDGDDPGHDPGRAAGGRDEPDGDLQSGTESGSDTRGTDEPGSDARDGAAGDAFEEGGFQPATETTDPALLERLDALEAAVERQATAIERQGETIEQLIEELRRGR